MLVYCQLSDMKDNVFSDYIACPNLSGCSVVIYLEHNI